MLSTTLLPGGRVAGYIFVILLGKVGAGTRGTRKRNTHTNSRRRESLQSYEPCYKKFGDFVAVSHINRCFRDKRCELIVVLDEPSEEGAFVEWARSFSGNVKIIVNDVDHEWRPPCKAINVGIRHALGDYVVYVDPETLILLPYDDYLFAVLPRRGYVSGILCHIDPASIPTTRPLRYHSAPLTVDARIRIYLVYCS